MTLQQLMDKLIPLMHEDNTEKYVSIDMKGDGIFDIDDIEVDEDTNEIRFVNKSGEAIREDFGEIKPD